jgi:hypothetical protein
MVRCHSRAPESEPVSSVHWMPIYTRHARDIVTVTLGQIIAAPGADVTSVWIKNPRNQVGKAANDKFIAFWRGQAVHLAGKMRYFDTEEDARRCLVRCDAAGRIVD